MINIKSRNGGICLEQTYPATKEMVEKINNNPDRFHVCLKDMRINYCMTCIENKEFMLYKQMPSASEKDIKIFKTACDTVMDFIEKLTVPVPEPAKELAQPIDKQVSENLEFCESVLEEYDGTEDEFSIIGAIVYCGSDDKEIAMPCGCIDRELFRELLTLYVEKYGNGNKNQAKPAKSTAS